MGALHAGHASLIESAVRENDYTLVSIFVNPLQFTSQSDLTNYPKTLQADLALCESCGIEAVWLPSEACLYPRGLGDLSVIQPRPSLADCLCGLTRPGHFAGVLTVLAKCFNLTRPSRAYFGEKDYQQLLLVTRMVEDLFFPLQVKAVRTVREAGGLALSSRNARLSADDLELARELPKILQQARSRILIGEGASGVLALLAGGFNFEYFEARNPVSLALVEEGAMRLFLAAWVGGVRLIDNISV